MKPIYRLIVLNLIIILLSACNPSETFFDSEPATPELTPTPLPTPVAAFETTISADGQIVLPIAPQRFSFPGGVDGQIKRLYVIPGQQVEAGQLLAEIDDIDLRNAVKRAVANLDVLKAEINNQSVAALPSDVAEAQSALNAAQSELNRVLSLPSDEAITRAEADLKLQEIELRQAQEAYDAIAYSEGIGMSPQAAQLQQTTLNYEKANAAYNEAIKPPAEAEIASARSRVMEAQNRLQKLQAGLRDEEQALNQARIYQSELSLQEAQDNLIKAKLYAPWRGTVTEVNAAPGVHINNAYVVLAQTDPLRFATTNFSERNLADISLGDEATIYLKSYPGVPFPGLVQRIELESQAKDGDIALFTVFFDFNSGDLEIRPGMTGRVEIKPSE
ncbi:efflux RND transporter periplasmic adaptor subunit [Anaerolineales bacterium HSG25]|nr:efflux RND transporter periplasmic adaptor subunit [Anaerolineales bacterium HSG25]